MAWNKKYLIASLLKAGVAISSTFSLIACGEDNGSNSDAPERVVLVSSIDDLGDCSDNLEGDTIFVKEEKSDFVCIKGKWTNTDSLDSHNREIDGKVSSSSTDKKNYSSSSFKYEQDSSAYILPKVVTTSQSAEYLKKDLLSQAQP